MKGGILAYPVTQPMMLNIQIKQYQITAITASRLRTEKEDESSLASRALMAGRGKNASFLDATRILTRRGFNVNIIMNIYVIKQPENKGEKRIFLCTRVNYTKT